MGFHYEFVVGGVNYVASEASATPVFAAMVSLVNAARLANGKGPIGFLNILLYSSHGNFTHDITEGDNSCSGVTPFATVNCCEGLGFQAARGWDPVTGLGSINFQAFVEFLKDLSPVAPSKYICRTITSTSTNSTTQLQSSSVSVTNTLYL